MSKCALQTAAHFTNNHTPLYENKQKWLRKKSMETTVLPLSSFKIGPIEGLKCVWKEWNKKRLKNICPKIFHRGYRLDKCYNIKNVNFFNMGLINVWLTTFQKKFSKVQRNKDNIFNGSAERGRWIEVGVCAVSSRHST